MKAKIKETGEIVDVVLNKCYVPTVGSGAKFCYDCSDGKIRFDTELDFVNVYTDWQQVRINAAIAAMQGLLSTEKFCDSPDSFITNNAIELADALIQRLKKRE